MIRSALPLRRAARHPVRPPRPVPTAPPAAPRAPMMAQRPYHRLDNGVAGASYPGGAMDFYLLGPFDARVEGRRIAMGRRQERRLLGLLLLEPGRVVPLHRLLDLLWDGEPPARARAAVHTYVARLRSRLAPHGVALVTQGEGYVAEVAPERVDAHRFAALVADARASADPLTRAALFTAALSLWRGPLLADSASDALRERVGTRLRELRLTAVEGRAEANLAAGRAEEATADLAEAVEQHPTREGLVGLFMIGLYRQGRPADALTAYHAARQHLIDELGIEPGPDLRRLYERILRNDPTLVVPEPAGSAPPPSPPTAGTVPAQLPLDVRGFTGRRAELGHLDRTLHDPQAGPNAVPIVAISGTAGVGKTALAIHWAHHVRARFPDGQLYLNLRGYDPASAPLRPDEAVRRLLDALAVPVGRRPSNLDAQVGFYRTVATGRRLLIVLDNARDADQVRPLLPGAPTCHVVVTSRNPLTSLVAAEGAHALALGLLPAPDARELLSRRMGAGRTEAEPAAVDEIVDRCAGLPLALSIVSGRAATRPEVRLDELSRQLGDARTALASLTAGDQVTDVRAVFSWSYHALGDPAARLFRLLGLHPGPDIGAGAAASLAGVPEEVARTLLAELAGAGLVAESVPGRFAFHDLLREYAGELTRRLDPDRERRAALHRSLDHYLHTADRGDRLLDPNRDPVELGPPQPGVGAEHLATYDEALAWFIAEHPVLVGVADQAAREGFHTHTWQFERVLTRALDRRGHWWQAGTVARRAIRAARHCDQPLAQALAHRSLGWAYIRTGRFNQAHCQFRHALRLHRELGDLGVADTHRNIAVVYGLQGRHRDGLRHSEQALALYRAAGHVAGQAKTLNNLGWQLALLGEAGRAVAYCEQSVELHRQVGARHGEATALDSLGYACHRLGQLDRAVDSFQEAVRIYRELGDRTNTANSLGRLGDTHEAAGDAERARDRWREALGLVDEVGNRDAEELRAKLRALRWP